MAASTQLVIHDKASKQTLNLDQLLPPEHRFIPGQLDNDIINGIIQRQEKATIFKNLKNYQGAEDDNFFYRSSDNTVSYGDLRTDGGLLSLLHEIGHAWQNQFHSDHANYAYDTFLDELRDSINSRVNNTTTQPEINQLADSNNQVNINEADPQFWLYNYDENEIVSVKSLALKEKIENFVKEERDAWAHALRALRYLRKHGIDLEPNLDTPDKIHDYIHYCLASYQVYIEKDSFELSPDTKNFTIDRYKLMRHI